MARRRLEGERVRAVVAAATVALASALIPIGLTLPGRVGGGTGYGPGHEDRATAGYLVDADGDGAIVEDPRAGVIRGVRSPGATAWSDRDAYVQRSEVSCAGRCPEAVASAGPAARIAPPAPDPAPRPLGPGAPLAGSAPLGRSLAGHVKRRVLAADGEAAVLAVGDGAGEAWLETWAGESLTARIPVPSVQVAWRPTSDGSAAAAIAGEPGSGRFEARSFRRLPEGWVPGGGAVAAAYGFGCAGAHGELVVADPRPRLVRPSGETVVIPGLGSGGECAFGGDFAVVAQLSATPAGAVARVVVVDGAGTVRWRTEVEGDTRVRADLRGNRFVLVGGGAAVERDGTGRLLRTIPGADDARYDDQSHLVVLDRSGAVRWLPPA